MESTRRGFLKGLGGVAAAGLAGCTEDEEEGSDEFEELLGEIEYDQRGRIGDYNSRFDVDVFDEESHSLRTDPEDVSGTSGEVSYHTKVETYQGGELSNLENQGSFENDETPVESILGSMIIQNLWIPIRNANGGGTGYEEAGEEFRERMGDISAKVEDQAGNYAELELSESKANQFWNRIEETYNEEYKENEADYMSDISAELQNWASENTEFSYK